jgi:hypothetical protein
MRKTAASAGAHIAFGPGPCHRQGAIANVTQGVTAEVHNLLHCLNPSTAWSRSTTQFDDSMPRGWIGRSAQGQHCHWRFDGHLERRHGERFAPSTVWRFLDRHAMTFKKNRVRQRAGSA